jgi:hypothetical protein
VIEPHCEAHDLQLFAAASEYDNLARCGYHLAGAVDIGIVQFFKDAAKFRQRRLIEICHLWFLEGWVMQ